MDENTSVMRGHYSPSCTYEVCVCGATSGTNADHTEPIIKASGEAADALRERDRLVYERGFQAGRSQAVEEIEHMRLDATRDEILQKLNEPNQA